jgi:peptidyl-prolyl cis-trans isomerase C
MRSLFATGLIAGLALSVPALAQDAAAPETGGYDASTVVATVNGTDITLGHVVVMLNRLPEQYQSVPDAALMGMIVEQLIDQTLLADTLSTDVADDPLSVKLHLENERRGNLALQALNAKIAESVTPEAVQAAYDAAIAGFEPATEYSAAHILVETEEEATDLRAQIEGGADFAALATEHSQDPGSGANGGSLGWFRLGQMVPEFEAAVVALEPGAVSQPVQTQFGWHLIRLDETRETTPPPLEAVRAEVENQVRQEAVQAEIQALRAGASIEVVENAVAPEAIRDSAVLEAD